MLNTVTLMGRLTKDPIIRYTQNQTAVASFSIACERDFKAKGSEEKEVDFINCVAWNNTAQFIEKYFSKGSMAVIEGRLQVRKWQDDSGSNREATEVVVNNIYFGESKKSQPANSINGKPASQEDIIKQLGSMKVDTDDLPYAEFTEVEDDLPF